MKGWSGKEDEGGGRLKTMKAQGWERDGKGGRKREAGRRYTISPLRHGSLYFGIFTNEWWSY